MKTVWMLDVDGVINADRARDRRTFVTDSSGRRWRITWDTKVTDFIREVHTSGQAEVTWCSTWCPDAHLLEEIWGLPELPRAWREYPAGGYVGGLKFDAAMAVLDAGNRLIWTDDMETPASDGSSAERYLYEQMTKDGRALLITPMGQYGLTDAHMIQIREFLG